MFNVASARTRVSQSAAQEAADRAKPRLTHSPHSLRRQATVFGVALAVLASTLLPGIGGSEPVAQAAVPCASLTPAAIQQVIDSIQRAIASESIDVTANGAAGAAYPSAPNDSLGYLKSARDKMLYLQNWLRTNGLDTPYVTNETAAYSVHGTLRETVVAVLYAQHWAMISAIYHRSAAAKQTYEETVTTTNLAVAIAPDAGRCYLRAVFP